MSRLRGFLAATLLVLLPAAASAQSPEMQDLLNQINGEFRRTQGERLSQNCDYTAIDVAKQALQRAGFTNMAAGPVVIGALESACKGALNFVGLGLAADAYSLAKCVYEYYTTSQDARGLLMCLGVEAGGIAAGKLVDWLDVDPATGALTGQVIDRIGDDLKAGGLDEAAAKLKEGEIRAFAKRLKEALEQVQRQAREKAENESPEPIVYTGFAYGCTVTIITRFSKGKPPTRGPNSVAMQIAIRDCDCYARALRVGKAMKEASIFVTVPVTFTSGPGNAPSWTADLGRMRTRIRSVCCDGTTSGVHPPGGGDEGGAHDGGGTGTTGGAGPAQPPKPPAPPPPPPPPYTPPTDAERCPECVPIMRDIENDRADIEAAQERINRIDEELRQLNSEASAQHDEIARAQRMIEINRGRVSLSSMSSGGMTRTQTLTADGVKVTTTTYPDGRTETREERTGNRDIDGARDRIAAAREKLKDIEKRRAEARTRRDAAVADKAAAEAKLRADRARLEKCLEECRKRRTGGGVSVGGVIGVTGTNPFNPDNPAGTPTGGPQPPPPPPPGSPGALQFSSPTYAAAEGQGAVTVTVLRTGGATGSVSVQYSTSQGSATGGADYQTSIGTLAWADGDAAAKTFSIPIADDSLVEATETFTVSLASPTGGATLGSPSTATVSIADNDAPPPPQNGSLQFSSPTYAATEGQGALQVTVTRTGGSSGAVTVQYGTFNGTAVAGSDFSAAFGTLSWAAGDASAKSFSVAILDDSAVEGSESFSVRLSNPTGGATLGSPSEATVTIADNDTQTGACGPSGSAWQGANGSYACSGSCNPSPSPQRVTVNDNRVTIAPFHAGGEATFTGCGAAIASDSSTLTYFGQSNHRATVTRSGNNYFANIQSSGGGSCAMSCNRTGP